MCAMNTHGWEESAIMMMRNMMKLLNGLTAGTRTSSNYRKSSSTHNCWLASNITPVSGKMSFSTG